MRHNCLIYMAILALAAISCNKGTAVGDGTEQTKDPGLTIGGYASQDEGTKMALEPGKGQGNPCVWNAGDQIRIRTSGGQTVATGTLTKGAGERRATFTLTPGSTTPGEGETVRVVYPAAKAVSFGSNTLETNQAQAGAANLNNSISAYAFACADITYSAGGFPEDFTLRHVLSYVRLSLASEAFAGVKLNSVTLSCTGASLSGAYSINYNTLAVSPKAGEGVDHVTVNFKDPIILNGAAKDIWFTVLPVNLKGKTVTITYNLTTPDETFDVDTTLPGIKLEQGMAYTIDRTSFNPVPGFCPIDTRIRAGEGHAYGQANTFLIQCKDGQTYTGGTYKENPDIPGSVTIDYRVRGDRATAVIPNDVEFGWATTAYGIATSTMSLAYVPRVTNYTNSNVDPTGFSFTVDKDNYTVTVTNNSAHAGAPILLMRRKDNKTILWGWSFWNIAADGTVLQAENIDGRQLANLEIGCPTTNYAQWAANQDTSGNPDPIWRMIHKYQWGRYLPVFWTTYWSLRVAEDATYSGSGNVPAHQGPVTLEKSLEYPYGLIVPDPTTTDVTMDDWLATGDNALWGEQKTVYDPCPKGWRVPDAANLSTWRWSGGWSKVTVSGANGWLCSGSFFPTSGAIQNKNTAAARIATVGGNPNGTSGAGGWWSNYVEADGYRPAALGSLGTTLGGNPNWWVSGTNVNTPSRAHGLSVRCMPDNDER